MPMANTTSTVYDVDLLRPGTTVTISSDTVLWFEFLLDPSLLEKHLNKSIPDPSPTDLIVKFLAVAPDIQVQTAPSTPKALPLTLDSQLPLTAVTLKPAVEDVVVIEETTTVPRNRKNLALKILSLKVAAYLKWDLGILQTKIPFQMQSTLLKDLLYLAMDEEPNVEKHTELVASSLTPQALFAVSLYHRWVLRAVINSVLPTKQSRLPYIAIPGLSDTNYSPAGVYEELMRRLEAQVPASVQVLSQVDAALGVSVPTFECFVMLTEDSRDVLQDWDKAVAISPQEFHCQLNFDVGSYHFYRDDYASAGRHFQVAQRLYAELRGADNLLYCTASRQEIEGYCAACDVSFVKHDLLNQMHRAINNHYTGIVGILQQDNVRKEIPQVYRDNLELDIQGAVSSGKFTVARDLLLQVQSLNMAKRIVSGDYNNTNYIHNLASGNGLDMLLNALKLLVGDSSDAEKHRIKLFLLNLAESHIIRGFVDKLSAFPVLKDLLSHEEVGEISRSTMDVPRIPDILLQTEWPMDSTIIQRSERLRMGNLEMRLILSYEPTEIRDLLITLGTLTKKPIWKVNNRWDLPIPVTSIVMSLPKGFLQDFCYILLAKAKELTNNRDFVLAEQLLSIVESEVNRSNSVTPNVLNKLTLLVKWENLLIRIIQFLLEEPQSRGDVSQLVSDSKQCLSALQGGDAVIPRTEIVEHCAIALLNLVEWEHLAGLDGRWKYFGMAAAIANACQDIAKHNGKKKVAKDLWELILPTFGPNPQTKRSSSANTSVIHRDSPTSFGSPQSRASLNTFLSKLVDQTVLGVVISLLSRLHNILRDEASLELAVEYVTLWPAVVSNANSYHTRAVSESLSQVLTQALHLYPNNISWLKLMADLNYVTNHHANALKYYLKAGIVSSCFFSQPIPSSVLDNQIYKRMIKCCSALACHTQAAVLCQFLDEVDHLTAFKSLGDAKTSDAMDSYYNCIWDTTILEYLVQLHVKRGEHHRKQQTIKIMGLLELNANNNEEIQREAINIRKARFMRSMARQYVIG